MLLTWWLYRKIGEYWKIPTDIWLYRKTGGYWKKISLSFRKPSLVCHNENGFTLSRRYHKYWPHSSKFGSNVDLPACGRSVYIGPKFFGIQSVFIDTSSTEWSHCPIVTYQKWFPMLNGGMVFSNIIPLFIQYHTTIWIVVWYWKIPYHHSPSENGNPLNFA